MPFVVEAAVREDLRRAGLPVQGPLPRLLTLLRASPETHLTVAAVVELAGRAGVAVTPAEASRQLEALAEHGLIGRLPTTGSAVVFDTVPEPHAHVVYGDYDQVIDLHVSGETLVAMVRGALARRPGEVDLLIRFRR